MSSPIVSPLIRLSGPFFVATLIVKGLEFRVTKSNYCGGTITRIVSQMDMRRLLRTQGNELGGELARQL